MNTTAIPIDETYLAECRLLPGWFGFFTQIILLSVSLLVLVGKKTLDHSDRTWFEFGLDSSKQVFGSVWVHLLNLWVSVKLSHKSGGDACDWYWVNIVVDCTIGTLIEYGLFGLFMSVLKGERKSDFDSGVYFQNGNVCLRRYWKQLGLWLFVCTVMKLCVVEGMRKGKRVLLSLAGFLLTPFSTNMHAKLMVVMIVTPCVFNSFQLWVVDNLIKKKSEKENILLA